VAELFAWFFLVSEEFPEVGEIDGGTLAPVEVVPVNMEDFLAFLRQQSREYTLNEPGSADNHIIYLVH